MNNLHLSIFKQEVWTAQLLETQEGFEDLIDMIIADDYQYLLFKIADEGWIDKLNNI